MSVRYAVYLAPPADGVLWTFGCSVLGYDAATGADCAPREIAGFDHATWHDLTEAPRRYGFHGTLKAPFRLAPGCTQEGLCAALDVFAQGQHSFELAGLEVREIGDFVALVPGLPVPALSALADDAVRELDAFRAPLSPTEIARRRPEALSARQRAHLDQFGYPYVLDDFRFHMTLTGPLSPEVRAHAVNALADAYAAAGAHMPVEIADVALYRQDAPQARFRIVHRARLRCLTA